MEKSKAIEGLKIALQTELNGIEFYRVAAEKTEDAKGKQSFKMLAEDEVKHFNALKQQYTSLIEENKWQSMDLGKAPIFKGDSPIFSDELRDRVKGRHFEVTALSIGALLETNSIDFYRKMKEGTDEPAAKELFGQLEEWEQTHLQVITKQLDLIKEDYWAEQGFTPLF